jgi:ATP-dependent exoDNAse (exonuclease V) beta subunit
VSLRAHDLVLASAGTGKTWQLTSRYLALLLRGDAPDRILATTFTRKAAGEILARVLQRLCDAAEGGRELATLQEEFPELEIDIARCREALARVTRDVERLRIGTLDSYFARIGRSYGLELGLPPAWSIADDVEFADLQLEALAELLDDAPHERVLELLRALQSDGAKRAVDAGLLRAIEGARALFLESDAAAWGNLTPPPAPSATEFAAAVAAIAKSGPPLTKAGEPAKVWARALDDARDAIALGEWNRLLGLTLAKKVVEGAETFDKRPIDPALRAAFQVVLAQAASVLAPELARAARATHALLAEFEEHFAALQSARGALSFDDLPRALGRALGPDADGPALDLAYRLDGRIDHLLLDEFQDTSQLQWRCLAQFAGEILAAGAERSFFCVGDVKQSIYGWRGADPELLAGLDQRYPQLAPARTLALSFRSSPVVLGLVNRVFTDIAANRTFERLPERSRSHIELWRTRFERHEAKKDELPGACVLLEAREPREGESDHRPLVELAALRVAELHAQAPHATIAVLLRRKKWIPELIHELTLRGIRASGEGGNPLVDSAAVLQVLALIWLADHPEAGVAAFHVSTSELGRALGIVHGDVAKARERAHAFGRDLVVRGYGASVGALVDRLRTVEEFGAWDRARLAQLVELALEWDARATLRPAEFVRSVREHRVEDPTASQVKVMTVHAAKGLEFDAVVLPELDESLGGRSPTWLVARAADGRIESVLRWPRPQALAALVPQLQASCDDVRGRELEGDLSVLYVALTRAIHRVEMIVEARNEEQQKRHAKDGPPLSFASVVRDALRGGAKTSSDESARAESAHSGAELSGGELSGGKVLWRDGAEGRWFSPPRERAAATVRAPRAKLVFAASGSAPELDARAPSAEEGGRKRAAKTWLRAPDERAVARGTLVHAWLARVEWLTGEDVDVELLSLRRDDLDPLDAHALALELKAALERPAVRALLTAPAAPRGDRQVVWHERRFAVELDGAHGRESWQGAFDRVVLTRRDGVCIAAELIDWKTDAVDASSLAARVEHYRPQLRAYARVLAHMTGLAPAAIRARLVFLATGDVVELGG